jgi:hypothetical protein
MTIDRLRHTVSVDGAIRSTKPREFAPLETLARRPSSVFSRGRLLDLAWPDPEGVDDERTVDVHVRRLRAKLGAAANTSLDFWLVDCGSCNPARFACAQAAGAGRLRGRGEWPPRPSATDSTMPNLAPEQFLRTAAYKGIRTAEFAARAGRRFPFTQRMPELEMRYDVDVRGCEAEQQ